MVALINAGLLAALYIYYHGYRKPLQQGLFALEDDATKNMHLF